jgi:thiamine biosynthesis protein ThiS
VPEVEVRFFGFRSDVSDFETRMRSVADGATVENLWDELRSSSDVSQLLAGVDERTVAVLVNRNIVERTQMKETLLKEGDTVTFMLFVLGG